MESSDFFSRLDYQDTPLAALTDFMQAEQRFEQSQQTDKMRFVGYVLELGYDTATIITSDPYKVAVGGIPRDRSLFLRRTVSKVFRRTSHCYALWKLPPLRCPCRFSRPISSCTRSRCPNSMSGPRANCSGAR